MNKIYHSILSKPMAILMAVAVLSLSFNPLNNDTLTLNAGTSVGLETVSMINSSLVTMGQTIDFRVSRDIKIDGKTVIAAGSIAKGQVMRSQHAKGLGKAGFIEVQIKTVTAVDGQEIFLTGGQLYQEGEDRQTLAIVLGIFVCILFLTLKGKDAIIPAGYQVTPYVATNTEIKV